MDDPRTSLVTRTFCCQTFSGNFCQTFSTKELSERAYALPSQMKNLLGKYLMNLLNTMVGIALNRLS
ncbi:hypothetical protein L195_g028255 [Trifolium pratense]|uniref:Uncharacterized protein n=1 Tax=Trifolium pratense TaxID=57577 RepID=A0A2K3L1E6_TRIPR|nr:hypothetical protein L195_g028255 [Trifolium pratense]